MATLKDSAAATPTVQSAETPPAAPAVTAKADATPSPAAAETPSPVSSGFTDIEALLAEARSHADRPAPEPEPTVKPDIASPVWAGVADGGSSFGGLKQWLTQRSLLAASVAVAALVGIAAGAAATSRFSAPAPEAPNPVAAVSEETRALRETVERLSGDLAKLQSRIETTQRNTTAQIGKLSERFERAEKANAEPNAKLAKIAEGLERLERKVAVSASAPEVTGSVTAVAKMPAKPAELEGWRLREFFNGRAVVENRGGALYEVGPGSTLPTLGRVESIKREDGKVVVLTSKGQISGTPLQPRRAPPPPPPPMYYRY